MTAADAANIVTMFFDQATQLGDRPFLWHKREGHYQSLTWSDTANHARALAAALRRRGVVRGDRIVIVAENRPEWLIADIAIMAAGGLTVPTYTTNTESDHRHILADSGAKAVIVSTDKLARDLFPAVVQVPGVSFVIAMEPVGAQAGAPVTVLSWDEMVSDGGGTASEPLPFEAITRPDPACIIYTSGTGGTPKGVVLSHGAILHNCRACGDALAELGLEDEVFLSFLPLSHSYEHTAGQFFPLSIGAQIYYAEGLERLATNLLEVRPTIMMAVPRLYEVLLQRITLGVRKAPWARRMLFEKALDLGRRQYQGRLGLFGRMGNAILDRLVRGKVRARFGGRLKGFVSGGGPLNPDVGLFFTALGVRIVQGYGQTEAAPLISVNRPRRIKIDTVGPPAKDVELRIADDGEILVRGELIMNGYWRNEEATREAVRDGWLHTGDIGELDEDGYLRITDRKKDIIVNSGGDNIAPARIEGLLTMRPEISQVMVYGDKHPHLVALVVPDSAWLTEWARDHDRSTDPARLAEDEDLRAALGAAIDAVNKTLSPIERVRRFAVCPEPFSIEKGELTPTMKIRRHVVKAHYGETLERLYRS